MIRVIWPFEGFITYEKLKIVVSDAIANEKVIVSDDFDVETADIVDLIDVASETGDYTFGRIN